VNAIRPVNLHIKVKEKFHKCGSLNQVYQLALAEEKELAKIKKMRTEEKQKKNLTFQKLPNGTFRTTFVPIVKLR